ncbi:MAG: hypothetical protein ABUL53_09035 [Bradyrhizobium guangdongense]|jgi:hypothetical protein
MKYLVARGLAQVLARAFLRMIRKSGPPVFRPDHAQKSNAPMPLQVLEKLPEIAGITNVINVTAKTGTRPA